MTCLVVLREKGTKFKRGQLVFAADSRISSGDWYQKCVRPKVTKRRGMLFAGTGVSYLCDLVGELCHIPEAASSIDAFSYLHNILHVNIKNVLIEKGYGTKEGSLDLPDDFEATVLIGYKGDLFEVCIGKQFGITIDPIDAPFAAGCGGRLAMGSILTTEEHPLKGDGSKFTVDERLGLAIKVAAKGSSGCDDVVVIKRESDNDDVEEAR